MGGAWITTQAIGPPPAPKSVFRVGRSESGRSVLPCRCGIFLSRQCPFVSAPGALERCSRSLLGPRYPALARSLPIDDRASGAALTPYCQLGRPVRARRWVEAGAIFTASVPMIEAGFPVLPAKLGKAREGKPNSQRSGTWRCAHRGNFLLLAEFGLIFALALAQMACRLIDLVAS